MGIPSRVDVNWKRIWKSFTGEHVPKHMPTLLPTYPFQNQGPFWFAPRIEENSKSRWGIHGKIVHPLLGVLVPTAGTASKNRISIFATSTSGLLERTGSWIRDHKIGQLNIFPGIR